MAKQSESPEEKQARETVETIATTIAQLSRQVSALLMRVATPRGTSSARTIEHSVQIKRELFNNMKMKT